MSLRRPVRPHPTFPKEGTWWLGHPSVPDREYFPGRVPFHPETDVARDPSLSVGRVTCLFSSGSSPLRVVSWDHSRCGLRSRVPTRRRYLGQTDPGRARLTQGRARETGHPGGERGRSDHLRNKSSPRSPVFDVVCKRARSTIERTLKLLDTQRPKRYRSE